MGLQYAIHNAPRDLTKFRRPLSILFQNIQILDSL